jgi:uncharacterized membrane protein YphA (DoxX/SURF4 family)
MNGPEKSEFRATVLQYWGTRQRSGYGTATNRKVAGSIFEVIFSIYLILPAALGPGAYSVSNRNEYQKHKNNNVSGE